MGSSPTSTASGTGTGGALLAGRLPAVPVANCSLSLCLCLGSHLSFPLTSRPIVSPGTTGDQTKQARGCLASNQGREVPSRPLSNVPTEVGWSSHLISSHPIPSLDSTTDPTSSFLPLHVNFLFFHSSFLLASPPAAPIDSANFGEHTRLMCPAASSLRPTHILAAPFFFMKPFPFS